MPKSAGNPTLNCCGGSFRTFGNMKRPVAARAAADAAENAPQAMPSHIRRVTSGELSSGSRELTFAAVAAAVVVFPATLTAGGGGTLGATGAGGFAARGAIGAAAAGAAGLSAEAPVGAEADALGASGLPAVAPPGGAEVGGLVSSAIIRLPFTVNR